MVKFGVMVKPGPYEQMARHAVLADNLGFDSVWVPDHLVLENHNRFCPETWTVLGAVAASTKKVTLGTSVTDPYRRHPAVLAQTVATLDHISRGRAVLGLGAGEAMNVEPYGILWNKRIDRMKETIEILRKLWKVEFVDYDGKVFKLSKAFIQVPSVQKKGPPIYIAANSPRTRQIVGTYGDGWLAEMMSPARYEMDIKTVADAARRAGRRIQDIDVTCVVTTAVFENYDEARKTALFVAKQRFLWWPKQLRQYGYYVTEEFDWNHLTVDKDTAEKILGHLQEVPDKPCEEVTIFGTPEDCIGKIEQYIRSGVTHFEFEIASPQEETCRIIKKEIVPYFKKPS